MASKPGLRRNAVATRARILDAARFHFSRAGYDQVGMRQIAETARVDAALIVRYFGSKEALFREVIAGGFSLGDDFLAGSREGLGERLVRYVAAKDGASQEMDPVLILLRSASSEQAGAILRQGLDEGFVQPLARWLGGNQAAERAGLIASTLFGLAFMREVVRIEPLTGADVDRLVALIVPTLQRYVDGDDLA